MPNLLHKGIEGVVFGLLLVRLCSGRGSTGLYVKAAFGWCLGDAVESGISLGDKHAGDAVRLSFCVLWKSG